MQNTHRAVVDIGSNSVRLVIFDLTRPAMREYLNEKITAGLGTNMSATGTLHPEGKEKTRKALRRFSAIIGAHGLEPPIAFATAALRESSDGPDFVSEMSNILAHPISVLSGEDEARYAALGVRACLPAALGLACDLGGRSLEIAALASSGIGGVASAPIGPLALETFGPAESQAGKVREAIREMTSGGTRPGRAAKRLFLVGGNWRALAGVHQAVTGYPLHILHNYSMTAAALQPFLASIIQAEKKIMTVVARIAARRASHLPFAALLLDCLIEVSAASHVVISPFGVREGILRDRYDANNTPLFGPALAAWLRDIPRRPIVEGACEMLETVADAAVNRADLAFTLAVHGPLTGLTHSERTMAALAVACRYARDFDHHYARALLDQDEAAYARFLGALMRLGCDFCGLNPSLLGHGRLDMGETTLDLTVSGSHDKLLEGDMVGKRLAQAARAGGVTPQLHII